MADDDSGNGFPTLQRGDSKGGLRAPRLAEIVANRLRIAIVDGDFDDSDIPTERVLLDEFGVSRPTLREALRILETEGLLTVRRGAHGGAAAHRPSVSTVSHYLGLVMQSERVAIDDLADARRRLEQTCAVLAATRPDHAATAAELEEVVRTSEATIDDPVEFTIASTAFHEKVASSCGNETLAILAGTLETIWTIQEEQWARTAVESGRYPDMQARRQVVRAHQRIQQAVAAGDATLVSAAVEEHLDAVHSVVIGNVHDRTSTVRVIDL